MNFAYDRNPPVRPLVDYAARSGVRVVIVQPDDPDSIGAFNTDTRLIQIAPSLLREPVTVLAAVLIHEIAHANQSYEYGTDACFSHEVAAYSWQAQSYETLRTGYEATPLARFQEQLVASWHRGQLDALVRSWPLYWRQCLWAPARGARRPPDAKGEIREQ